MMKKSKSMKGIEIVTVFQIVKICAHWSKVIIPGASGVFRFRC